MFTPIVFALLFAAAFGDRLAHWTLGTAYSADPLHFTNLLSIVGTGVWGLIFGYAIAKAIGLTLPTIWTLKRSIRLSPLEGNNQKFFLHKGPDTYTYRRELGRTISSLGSIHVDNDVTIKRGGDGSWLETYIDQFTDSRHRIFALSSNRKRYEFLIPEGSLVDPSQANQQVVQNKATA